MHRYSQLSKIGKLKHLMKLLAKMARNILQSTAKGYSRRAGASERLQLALGGLLVVTNIIISQGVVNEHISAWFLTVLGAFYRISRQVDRPAR